MTIVDGNATNNNLVVGADGAIYCMVKPPVHDADNFKVDHGSFTGANPGHLPIQPSQVRNFGLNMNASARSVPGGTQSFVATPSNTGNMHTIYPKMNPYPATMTPYPTMAPFPTMADGSVLQPGVQHHAGIVPDLSLSLGGFHPAPHNNHSYAIALENNVAPQHGGPFAPAAFHTNSATMSHAMANQGNLMARTRRRPNDTQDSFLEGPAKRIRFLPSHVSGQTFQGIPSQYQTLQGVQSLQGATSLVPQMPHKDPALIVSGRFFPLSLENDDKNLSRYQCLARKQIELFEATVEEASTNAQGRNRPIAPGKVGIRCVHCCKLPPKQRKTGSVYYPNRLDGVYQTAQKMTVGHTLKHCKSIPDELRTEILFLKDQKSSDGGGKRYWTDGVRSLGVMETEKDGLLFLAA